MTRRKYETEEDLAKETEVRNTIAEAWDIDVHKLPASYQLDCCGINEDSDIEWFGEIKCRDNTSTLYDTLLISLLKIERGLTLSRAAGIPFYIFAKFTDGKTMFHKYDFGKTYRIAHGGRTVKTRDSADVEPVIHIPMKEFTEIHPPLKWKEALDETMERYKGALEQLGRM